VSNIGALIQAYQDKHGTSDRALARRIGVTATLIGNWKRGSYVELPRRDRLHALADQIGVDYNTVLRAVLLDTNYLEDVMGNAEHPAPTSTVTPLSEAPSSVADEQLQRVAKRPKKRAE
jgi:transcriptional regulator with XRE-family HTH domain